MGCWDGPAWQMMLTEQYNINEKMIGQYIEGKYFNAFALSLPASQEQSEAQECLLPISLLVP